MSRRRAVAHLGALAVAALSRIALAQTKAKVRRIGFLSSGSASVAGSGPLKAFRDAMRELGWVEGASYVLETRYAEGRSERLPELAADLVRAKVEVLGAGGGAASVAAREATPTIPIVMIAAGDPVRLNLVTSLARPGGNVTGVAWDVGLVTFAKALELLIEALPGLRRVGILVNPANPGQALAIAQLKDAAGSLRLPVVLLEASTPRDFDKAFAALARDRTEAMLVVADPMFIGHRERLAELAKKYALPSMFGGREYVEAGGLMGYGPSLTDAFARAAVFTDRILKGARPGDLPVEQPTKFDLTVNLTTAERLGVTIPQALLLRADVVR